MNLNDNYLSVRDLLKEKEDLAWRASLQFLTIGDDEEFSSFEDAQDHVLEQINDEVSDPEAAKILTSLVNAWSPSFFKEALNSVHVKHGEETFGITYRSGGDLSKDELSILKDLEEVELNVPLDETLIYEDEFEDYAQELAFDTGAVSRKCYEDWPLNCINWEKAAEQLKQDYSEIEIDGRTYYYRSY